MTDRKLLYWGWAFALATLLVLSCATTPKTPTQTVYAAEIAFADAIQALGAAKAKIPPSDYATAVKTVAAAQTVLYAAEQSALSGNATATQTGLCAFQALLNQIIAAYGGKQTASICVT